MTISFITDEHVPRVFVSTLRSRNYTVVRATDVLDEGVSDEELLNYAAGNELVLITNDKKDFSRDYAFSIDHAGIVIYTDALFLRSEPATAVHILERIIDHYPPDELAGNLVWLDQWRPR